jgi:mxaK protein
MAMSAPRRLLLSVAMLALVLSAGIVYELYRLKSARQFNAALEHNAFLEVNQASARGRFATAYGLQQLGEFEEAIRAYAEVEPDDAETAAAVRFNLANLYLRRALVLEGDENRDLVIPLIELAKENYRELLRRDSQHWDAKYNLELALALLPDLEEQESEDDIMPERSPRANTATPARRELP